MRAIERELRRRCRNLLRELAVHPPLDVKQMCDRLADQRGRPIVLLPHPIPVPGPFGVWLATSRADHIIYQERTTRQHQSHIILHELGHVIADHRGDEQDEDLLQELCPHLAASTVHSALNRISYDSAQEREAETVATIILQWASILDPLAPRLAITGPSQRMQAGLSGKIGWL